MPGYPELYRGTTKYLLVYAELISAARYRGLTTYQAIAQLADLPSRGNLMGREVGKILGEITQAELEQGRPMLSALAVGVSGVPGDGFYHLAQELGTLADDSKEARLAFWEAERLAVYQAWARTFKQ